VPLNEDFLIEREKGETNNQKQCKGL
jgi:hypothetical protein